MKRKRLIFGCFYNFLKNYLLFSDICNFGKTNAAFDEFDFKIKSFIKFSKINCILKH